jgi:hypothetical protein
MRCVGKILMHWIVVLGALLTAFPVRADFWDGLAAYDAGNYAEARAQWRSLADSGDAEAQASLAGLYAQGLGVLWDFDHAAHWFRRAAAQGHAIAQLNLGDYYARGRGVPRDLERAWLWLGLAARQGNKWAEARRDAVELQMTEPALRDAKRRLAEWRPALE